MTATPVKPAAQLRRCAWAENDPLLRAYHDEEWGVPEWDDRALWEKLMLDGFQAGLAWITVLRKRDALRRAFKGFDPVRVARFKEADMARLLEDAAIIRSRAKIQATIDGARIYLTMEKEGAGLASFAWGIAGGKPIVNNGPIEAKTPLSERMSAALKERGFKFVGPVIVHAWMQATGMVNDHEKTCFRRNAVDSAPGRTKPAKSRTTPSTKAR